MASVRIKATAVAVAAANASTFVSWYYQADRSQPVNGAANHSYPPTG